MTTEEANELMLKLRRMAEAQDQAAANYQQRKWDRKKAEWEEFMKPIGTWNEEKQVFE